MTNIISGINVDIITKRFLSSRARRLCLDTAALLTYTGPAFAATCRPGAGYERKPQMETVRPREISSRTATETSRACQPRLLTGKLCWWLVPCFSLVGDEPFSLDSAPGPLDCAGVYSLLVSRRASNTSREHPAPAVSSEESPHAGPGGRTYAA